MKEFDVTIIGGGPGGYVAAIRSAQLGLKVAIIEKRKTLGGTCLNVGCIPSKALLDSSEQFHITKHKLSDHGIHVSDIQIDIAKMMERKNKVVSEVCEGVDFLMKKNKIERLIGFGKLVSQNQVEVSSDDGSKEIIQSKNIILATGSVPIDIPGFDVDGEHIITSDHAIALTKVPKKLVIIGAGVIGLELGSVWNRLGSEVIIIELMDRLLGTADKQMASYAKQTLEKQGLKFFFGHKVLKAEKKENQVIVSAENQSTKEVIEISSDVLMVSVGRRPYTDNLGAKELGIEFTERGRIKVKPNSFVTNIPNVYAIGDVIDGPMLAHKAEDEGIAVAEIIAGQAGHVNYTAIPWIVYTWPEIAWVGYGEEELKEKGIEYKVGKSIFRSNGRAKAMNEAEGLVKILSDKKTDKVLGVYIIGPRASDMIAEMAIAFEFGASAEDIARTCHAHPTLSEVIREAAMAVDKWSIHG
jgi:dihydrolipoamide dehydrogenase